MIAPIKASELPSEGVEINETLSLSLLNDRMNEANGNDILFLMAPEVVAKLRPMKTGISLRGQIVTKYSQPCARCTDQLELPLTVEIDLVFKPKSERQDEDPSDEVIIFEGDYVEIEEHLQENLIVALNPFHSPPCNESGDCSECGFNLNQYCDEPEGEAKDTIKLGDLLKKAMSKN